MSSSPSSVKQRSPKRTSPKRTPLQERTPSQANEISSRLGKEPRSDQENSSIYNATPFPTKPAHVLLPSTLRKQKSAGPSPLTETFGFTLENEAGRSSDASRSSRGGAQPTVRLKRSVKALRDLYEAQAEEASRPSTATSPPLRPSTTSSTRLRSMSSNESLSGAYAWESLRKISSDDLALLPTLPSGGRFVTRLSSRSSFTSIAEKVAAISSPNYKILGVTSSPRPLAFKDWNSPVGERFEEGPSSSAQDSSSSPNVVRLARTSSTDQFHSTDQSSSPNVIKLGTSSPSTTRPGPSNYSIHSRSSSDSSRKRKRADTGRGRPFAERLGARNPLASSPPSRYISSSAAASIISPTERDVPSSASQSICQTGESIDESSPVVQVLGSDGPSSDGSSLAETHSSLQEALSSSPPRIQYPVVRAPPISQHTGLVVPKRNSRSMSTDISGPKFSSRLSAVPSEGSWSRTRRTSEVSIDPDELDEYLNSDDLAPASNYIINQTANQSLIRIVPDSSSELHEHDSHEATDEVSALPVSEYVYRSPPLRPVRTGSYIGSSNSTSLSRLNSMKSFTQSRHNSFISTSPRPSSSASTASAIPVPLWARRYYSGFYRDSFHYLYNSGSHLNLNNLPSQTQSSLPTALALPAPSRPDTSNSNANPSARAVHPVITQRIGAILRPRTRPRLEARKSHTLPGIGPLVSNPISAPAEAALAPGSSRRQSYSHPPHQSLANHSRSISAPLQPADPRAHWAGIVEIHEAPHEDGRGSSYTVRHHTYSYSHSHTTSQSDSLAQSVIYYPGGIGNRRSSRWSSSPHLHHDTRLNTGSSASRGFGFPFNTKSRWSTSVPDLLNFTSTSTNGGVFNLRSIQVASFALGFIMPVAWFVAAFLPLPRRPDSFGDLEKEVHRESRRQWQVQSQAESRRVSQSQPRQSEQYQHQYPQEAEMDILAKLRLERHRAGMAELNWQNARWWRNLNRWMCAVGLVVVVLVVVLAVLGTRRDW